MSDVGAAFGVVILGAGASRRMGTSKLLLPWGETTVIGHLAQQWRGLGVGQVAVVCRYGDMNLEEELRRLGFADGEWVVNSRAEEGMFSSVRAASLWDDWKAEITHFVISLGDQPLVRSETLLALLEFSSRNVEAICQPALRGGAAHPVILPREVFEALRASEAKTLKEFLAFAKAQRRFIEIDDDALALDLDTPADYEAAVRKRC